MDTLLAALASFMAGCIDSIVGGGGLILVPALFALYPNATPATLFGTNKSASIWGTAFATLRYARHVQMRWHALLPATTMALLGGFLGAWTVTHIDPTFLRRTLPFILLAVLLYTLARKQMGSIHAPLPRPRLEIALACGIGLVIGFYDGLFGPGTGSFFIFLFVRLLGYDFLHASAAAKLLNVATNIAALVLFGLTGHIWWQLGLTMAATNLLGSGLGTYLALRHGASFVRGAFILVVALLILKTGADAFWS